ncbi:MAG TPA: HlyD family efflux transporter periplasmic adaptor subunit [Balneolaceae bacterium]
MDKKIEKKFWSSKRIAMFGGGFIFIAFFSYAFISMDLRSTLNVEKEKLTISTVKEGAFQEFIAVTGTVKPIKTVYLAALQGGIVEDINIESGTMVEQGDTVLTLSNSALKLRVLQRTSAIYDQINQTRNSRLNIKKNVRSLKTQLANAEYQLSIAGSTFQRLEKLYDKKVIAEQKFDEARENFEYQQKRYQLLYTTFRQDSIKAQRQLSQIDESLLRMQKSLAGVQNILDKLVITAPISGLLSTIQLNLGQSISAGERIGQVAILDDYKIRLNIDEYYLARIRKGLQGTVEIGDSTYNLNITKVYPVVKDGQFKIDMEFSGAGPAGLRRGQTLRIRLELGESSQAIILARGGFYQTTGGNWVYLISADGSKAYRHNIRLGRQNPEYFEVLSGLGPGDEVITSSYDTFGDSEVLNLE